MHLSHAFIIGHVWLLFLIIHSITRMPGMKGQKEW